MFNNVLYSLNLSFIIYNNRSISAFIIYFGKKSKSFE